MKKKYDFNFSPKTTPFSHQVEAIKYVENSEKVALFDEQGLGKTKIVIEAICNNISQGSIDGALVICKKTLINTWKDEIEMHSHLKNIILRGSASEKGSRFMGYSHFYITNYESVISEVSRLKMLLGIRKMAMILDESHKIKSPDSETAKAIFELKDYAKKRVIISGTPVANKPIDLWAQFYFLDDGDLLGTSFSEFKDRYTIDFKKQSAEEQEKKLAHLKELIVQNSIRRKKDNVLELPQKIYIDEYVELEGIQKIMYNQLKDDLYIEVTNLDGERVVDESSDILKKLLRLAQIASNPYLIDKSYNETPAKFKLLDSLVGKIIDNNEKLIIWSSFTENIRSLYKRYRNYGSLMLFGEIPIEKRNDIVKLFKSDSGSKILIANPAAAREGLTLTVANNAIYLDRNFNLVDYLQSQDRIHRISQTKECRIYKLIASNSIDEYIDEILYKKHSVAEYIQGDSNTINKDNDYLTKSQLLKILG